MRPNDRASHGRRGPAPALMLWGGLATLALLWVWGCAMNWDPLLAIMGPDGRRLALAY